MEDNRLEQALKKLDEVSSILDASWEENDGYSWDIVNKVRSCANLLTSTMRHNERTPEEIERLTVATST